MYFMATISLLTNLVRFKKSKEYKLSLRLSSYQKQALHGLTIGYLYVERAKETHRTRFCFDQGTANIAYARHLYDLFSSLFTMPIYTTNRLPAR